MRPPAARPYPWSTWVEVAASSHCLSCAHPSTTTVAMTTSMATTMMMAWTRMGPSADLSVRAVPGCCELHCALLFLALYNTCLVLRVHLAPCSTLHAVAHSSLHMSDSDQESSFGHRPSIGQSSAPASGSLWSNPRYVRVGEVLFHASAFPSAMTSCPHSVFA